jgi:hypothetical protein
MKKVKGWDTVCSVCTAGVSVVCMSSMGAAMAAAVAAAGAGATGMSGMGSMGATQTGLSGSLRLTRFFESVGLGMLNQLPNAVAQPLLAALLVISVGATYIAYRGHRRPGALVLTLGSAIAMYTGIYIWMSEPMYFISLVGLVAAAIWGFFLARSPGKVPAR